MIDFAAVVTKGGIVLWFYHLFAPKPNLADQMRLQMMNEVLVDNVAQVILQDLKSLAYFNDKILK